MLAPIARISKLSAVLALALVATAAPGAARETPLRSAVAPGTVYRLVEGSYLVDDCLVCGRPTIQVPIRGSFQLVPSGQDPLYATFTVRAFRFGSESATQPYAGFGRGRYRRGGEVALREEMSLLLRINDRTGIRLSSGLVPPQARLPWIEMDLAETSPPDPLHVYRLHLVAVEWAELWFSTEWGFTPSDSLIGRVSDGDLLSAARGVVRRNGELTSALGIMPPAPDLGLDAVAVPFLPPATSPATAVPEIWFSLEEDAWSEPLGALHHGDLLSEDGRVARSFLELLQPFVPMPPIPDLGLDAATLGPDGSVIFSIEEGFFSERLGIAIAPSDLLDEGGSVFRRGRDLLANFRVRSPISGDLGTDAAHVFPGGEVWFSTDADFVDERYGPIGHGDLLSDTGRVVARNRELLASFGPIEDLADFGLDALHVVARPSPFDQCGSIVEGAECPLFAASRGGLYVLSTTDGFEVGDRIRVTGELRRGCATTCMQGNGCIEVRAIAPCPRTRRR